MIAIDFNGVAAFLLDDVPEWGRGISLDARIPSAYERSLTGKETRRQTGDTPRLALKWTSILASPAQVTNLRNSLQTLAQQPVLCPFWPGGFDAGAMPTATAQWYV
ncbi:MAG: hypothetical protein KGR98_09215, partial [Verrucomicrobia bacterium]|nr:hypothetical protein [Verrucomicrobiota bacterium]